jgi:hypothetical protein
MTAARESSESIIESGSVRCNWVRPSVQRLSAGSAENLIGPANDATTNPS